MVFAEGSKTQNEEGIYLGIETSPIKNWKFSGYYDMYRFPWLHTGADAPSRGNDFLVQADFNLTRQVNMYWRFKTESKEENPSSEETGIPPLVKNKHWSARYHINYGNDPRWQFKNRVEISSYQPETGSQQYGYLVYQDVVCTPFNYPLSFTFRYAIFETDSYDTRLLYLRK